MASAERETEESRVRGVAAEVAAAGSSRFAGVARHQTTRSSSPSGQRSAERAPTPRTRATGRLPAAALAVDRRSSRPPPVSAIYSALPSAGVSSSLRRTTALPGARCLPGRAGLPAVLAGQRRKVRLRDDILIRAVLQQQGGLSRAGAFDLARPRLVGQRVRKPDA